MGKYYPNIKSFIKLWEIINVDIDYILGLSEQRNDPIYIKNLKQDETLLIQTYRKLDSFVKASCLCK